jgi:hypothetical protein
MLSLDFTDAVKERSLLADDDDVIRRGAELPAALAVDVVDENAVDGC